MIQSPPTKREASTASGDILVQESPDGERLIIRMSGSRHGRLYGVTVALAALIVVMVVGFTIAARHRPGLWVFVAIGLVALLAVAARAVELRRVAQPHELSIE